MPSTGIQPVLIDCCIKHRNNAQMPSVKPLVPYTGRLMRYKNDWFPLDATRGNLNLRPKQ
jgi:hypothetical protein